MVGAVAAYAICWVFAYSIMNEDLDGELMLQYFVLAWTGNGFVRPTVTWLLSVVAFSCVLLVWWALVRRLRRSRAGGMNPEPPN